MSLLSFDPSSRSRPGRAAPPRLRVVRPAALPEAAPSAAAVRCRLIGEGDIDAVIALFRKGFADRSEAYWRQGLARHLAHGVPEGYPTYGYMLEHAGRPVGVLLTLFAAVERDGVRTVRCNLSSWYVEPAFRAHAGLLDKVATRRREVTYLNVTPTPHTWAIQEERGFRRYCQGQMLAVPLLARGRRRVTAAEVAADDPLDDLSPWERDLVRDHLAYGCIVLLGTEDGRRRPFVFQVRTIGLIPNNTRVARFGCAQLIYAPSLDAVARFARPIGRLLLRRHRSPFVVLDADARVPGLTGRYFPGRAPKYARGEAGADLGDLAYTELVLFGP